MDTICTRAQFMEGLVNTYAALRRTMKPQDRHSGPHLLNLPTEILLLIYEQVVHDGGPVTKTIHCSSGRPLVPPNTHPLLQVVRRMRREATEVVAIRTLSFRWPMSAYSEAEYLALAFQRRPNGWAALHFDIYPDPEHLHDSAAVQRLGNLWLLAQAEEFTWVSLNIVPTPPLDLRRYDQIRITHRAAQHTRTALEWFVAFIEACGNVVAAVVSAHMEGATQGLLVAAEQSAAVSAGVRWGVQAQHTFMKPAEVEEEGEDVDSDDEDAGDRNEARVYDPFSDSLI